ncbi:hypothetical protein RB595_009484 [Gaeumannomyces hyphopodioides]
MASLFQSFRGSAMPKRLLRYALSRLELLDSDALDMDNLDLALGRNTVLEFRDVGIKLQKLERLLNLPPAFTLQKAKVILLRVTIPMDFYTSPILVEVDGVHVRLKVDSKEATEAQAKKQKTRPSSSEVVPNTVDLAQSFLEQQPSDEKERLEAALAAETQDLGASLTLSEDESDEESSFGTGQALSLPAFLADFLQGIVDRTQIQIRGVTFQLDVGVPVEPNAIAPDVVTFELAMGRINVECVTTTFQADEDESPKIVPKEGKRHVSLENITAFLISEANVFSTFERTVSVPPSLGTESSAASALRSPMSERSYASSHQRGDDPLADSMLLDQSQYLLDDSEDALNIPYELDSSTEDVENEIEPPASSLSTPRASMYLESGSRPRTASANISHSALEGNPPPWGSPARGVQSEPALPVVPPFVLSAIQQGPFPDLRVDESIYSSAAGSVHSVAAAPAEDLSESHLFSHEEAESMYMSAFSATESVRLRSRMPGGWDSADASPESSPKAKRPTALSAVEPQRLEVPADKEGVLPSLVAEDVTRPTLSEAAPTPAPAEDGLDGTTESDDPPRELLTEVAPDIDIHDDPATQGCPTPQEECATPRGPARLAKRILALDNISVYVPSKHNHVHVVTADGRSMIPTLDATRSGLSKSTSPHLPGAFSVVSASPASPPPSTSQLDPDSDAPEKAADRSLEVILSPLNIQFDASIGFLLAMVVSRLLSAISSKEAERPNEAAGSPAESSQTSAAHEDIRITLEEVSLLFLERLAGVAETPDRIFGAGPAGFDADILLQTQLRNVQASITPSETGIDVESFTFGYTGEDASIISFDRSLQMMASVKDAMPTPGSEVSIKIRKSPSSTQVDINTLPLHVRLDLRRLDETFSWFGGLSSFLSMGSSMTSNQNVPPPTKAPARSAAAPRGVRFEAPINPDDRSASSDNKVNMRINAIQVDLIGKDCNVVLETSALKLVSRDEGIGMAMTKILLNGPYSKHSGSHPPVSITVIGTRLEFSMAPKDADLERLLELISPSKLKYDEDQDEIMVETLLRQRKKGSVLRIWLDKVNLDVSNLPHLSCLPSLGEDLARLGTVAKYLPEDDRPGLLSLTLVRSLNVSVDVGGRFGVVDAAVRDFDIAHITVPALVATAVGSLTVDRNHIEKLVGSSLLPSTTLSKTPVLMMRMIGDVIEPTITVKLHGINLEYRVPTIIDLLDLDKDATPEDFEAGLAASVAQLGEQAHMAISSQTSTAVRSTPGSGQTKNKPPKVDLAFIDCIIGLNPLGLTSKMGVVLADSRLVANLGDKGDAEVVWNMKKASVVLIDDISVFEAEEDRPPTRHAHRSSDASAARQKLWGMESSLCSRGFVSVCQIHSASVTVRVADDGSGDKAIEAEIRDNLLVLETCADSTQTLIALANALKPPTPPSKEVKFKTEIIPVEDLLASISPDAFGKAEGDYNFDDDFGEARGLPGDDDVSDGGSEMIGAMEAQYYPHPEEGGGEKLFDASSSMTSDRTTTQETHDDGILLDLEQPASGDLGIDDNFFGATSATKGAGRQWDSARNKKDDSDVKKAVKSPLKVKVRDVHAIWNLFDGYDWQRTRDAISKTVQEVEARAYERRARLDRRSAYDQDFEEEETVIGDFLFNSIYIGIPAHQDPRELSNGIAQDLYGDRQTDTESVATTQVTATPSRLGSTSSRPKSRRLKLHRSRHHKITFELRGVNVDLATFPRGSGETESSVDLSVKDLDIFDHVPGSTWKKFATYDRDAGEREIKSNMVQLELLNVRPVPDLAATEIVLKVNLLPLRLHVDQDALDFITRFFEFKDDSIPLPGSPSDVPFIQRAEISAIPVRLDFKPKRVDYAGLRSGHTTEFMNFMILDGASMTMRHTILYGVSGFERLGKTLNDIWMPDIKRNQLPGVLAGLAPVRSLVNVGSGFRHLVEIPVREYKQDGRVMRSLGRGAALFARTTGTEMVKLGAKVAVGTQYVLQGAEGLLVSNPEQGGGGGASSSAGVPSGWDSDEPSDSEERKQISLYADQPTGVIQGLRHAYSSLSRDLSVARDAIIAVPAEVMESSSAKGAAKAVIMRAPTIIFRPAIGATKAIGQTLMGATNSLDPQNIRRMEDKYKSGPGR